MLYAPRLDVEEQDWRVRSVLGTVRSLLWMTGQTFSRQSDPEMGSRNDYEDAEGGPQVQRVAVEYI